MRTKLRERVRGGEHGWPWETSVCPVCKGLCVALTVGCRNAEGMCGNAEGIAEGIAEGGRACVERQRGNESNESNVCERAEGRRGGV